jgi:hypothetical protein
MPKINQRNQRRRDTFKWKRRGGDRRITIDCPRCHRKVGIPVDVYQNGVESDQDKQLTTQQLRTGVGGKSAKSITLASPIAASTATGDNPRVNPLNFICESCGYREGATAFRPEFKLVPGDTCND